ncbi:(2Fe-2S) ferredoxin domain-containing protein, partial [Nodosilinea sp. LEGE 07088]|uniref:(2Fe-2S) ferredoxin domain-containing protein n=1 Tax=Nodosilinea sp. LEGE 07088 TaxID=2777968 RepID=UPI00187E6C74
MTQPALRQLSTQPCRIRCCTVGGCLSANSLAVKEQLETAVIAADLDDQITIAGVGCMGLCSQGPLVQVDPSGELYAQVTPDQAAQIVAGVGSRGQGVGSRGQGIGNREQGIGNREQGIGSRGQGIGNR